jgi:hypothetical protein
MLSQFLAYLYATRAADRCVTRILRRPYFQPVNWKAVVANEKQWEPSRGLFQASYLGGMMLVPVGGEPFVHFFRWAVGRLAKVSLGLADRIRTENGHKFRDYLLHHRQSEESDARIATALLVTYFGGIVGPGLYQFNVVVPDLPDGDQEMQIKLATRQHKQVWSYR